MLPIEPPRALGGERNLALVGAILPIALVFVSAQTHNLILEFVLVLVALAFYGVWVGLINLAWRVDPWLSRTLPRFGGTPFLSWFLPQYKGYPHFIAAHSTGAVSDGERKAQRDREGFRR